MEKDYQNNNSISDAANNNGESNKPEHEIKVEIVSIEVVGEYNVLVLIVTSALFFLSIGQMVFLSSKNKPTDDNTILSLQTILRFKFRLLNSHYLHLLL